MLILSIDSSGHTASVAVVTEDRLVAEFSMNCGYTHSQTLMPMVEAVLSMAELDKGEIDYIACVSGPGSFTGLRIGAACAKGMAAGLGIKMVNVSALDALAYNVFKNEGYVVPVMDARRGQVYSALYKWGFAGGEPELMRLSSYMAESIEHVAALGAELGGSVTFLGDGVLPHKEYLSGCGFNFAPQNNALQRAASAGALAIKKAAAGQVSTPGDFKLFYLRKPQAEREAEARGD